MRRLWVSLGLALMNSGAGAVELLLPDLVPYPKPGTAMYDAFVTGEGADRKLVFGGAIANFGAGHFEIRGSAVPGAAVQRIYDDAGGFVDRPVGGLLTDNPKFPGVPLYHDLGIFRLRAVRADGGAGPIVASSPKEAWSTFDSFPIEPPVPGASATKTYFRQDGVNERVGVAMGWVDLYSVKHPAQYIPLAGVPDGTYWLEMVVNPAGNVQERDLSNNALSLRMTLSGSTVTFPTAPLPPPPPPPPPGALLSESFSRPDGLVTNEYAYYNPSDPSAVKSAVWDVTSGSLFAASGEGWTGVPDAAFPNAGSTNGTGSKTFRLRSTRTDLRDVDVALGLNLAAFVDGADAAPQDGVSLVLREAADGSAYYVTLARRDGSLALRKKLLTPAGFTWTNLDAAALAAPLGAGRRFHATVRDAPDGSVALALAVDGLEVLRSTDTGSGGAPLRRPGRVGLYGSNAEFRFDDFTVAGPGGTGEPAPAAPAGFAFHNMYVFPNPAAGGKATVRVQVGRADDVSVNIYDVAGRLVHSGGFGAPVLFDDGKGAGPQLTYDYVWEAGGTGSGVYHCVVTARRAGFAAISRNERLALVR